jgi:5-methylthioadenosine/S-adenosylhomocysteine deaminase
VFEEHAVVVSGSRIAALLPVEQARQRHAGARWLELPGHALLPGLVNAHTHAAMTLMRGLADDLPLMRWLQEHVWPAEAAHVSREFVRDGTLLAAAEMLRGGVTCMNDMYFFPEAAAEAALATGIRAALGIIVIEFPTAYASDPQDYLAKGLAMRDAFRHEPLLSFCMAPHAPYTVSDTSFESIATLAGQLELPVHVHVQETAGEVAEHLARHGVRPVERLRALGLTGPGLISVHSVHLDEREIALYAREGSHVVHCPSSNLKLASGFAPVAALLDAGVNVALGTDGAASNNRLDLWEEMRTAALLAKGASGRADVLPAARALEMATLGGARALGLEERIGSIEPGKQADLVAVNLDAPELSPFFDPLSHLVYAAGRHDVSHVWVAGRARVSDGRLVDLDPAALREGALRWQALLAPHGNPRP